jgi:hypothetical protein
VQKIGGIEMNIKKWIEADGHRSLNVGFALGAILTFLSFVAKGGI